MADLIGMSLGSGYYMSSTQRVQCFEEKDSNDMYFVTPLHPMMGPSNMCLLLPLPSIMSPSSMYYLPPLPSIMVWLLFSIPLKTCLSDNQPFLFQHSTPRNIALKTRQWTAHLQSPTQHHSSPRGHWPGDLWPGDLWLSDLWPSDLWPGGLQTPPLYVYGLVVEGPLLDSCGGILGWWDYSSIYYCYSVILIQILF